jgi:hypothetical protein
MDRIKNFLATAGFYTTASTMKKFKQLNIWDSHSGVPEIYSGFMRCYAVLANNPLAPEHFFKFLHTLYLKLNNKETKRGTIMK